MNLRAKRCLCVLGTDTDAGKTVAAAALGLCAWRTGLAVAVLKPVQTGCIPTSDGGCAAPDLGAYFDACPDIEAGCLVRLEPACSPHLALRLAGRELRAADLAAGVRNWIERSKADVVIIEGAGGVLTPLNESESILDALRHIDCEVVLVAANRLGALNHALLSVEAVKSRGMRLAGFVLANPLPEPSGEDYGLCGRGRADEGPGADYGTGRERGADAKDDDAARAGFRADDSADGEPGAGMMDEAALAARIAADNKTALAGMAGLPCIAELAHEPGIKSPVRGVRRAAWSRLAFSFDGFIRAMAEDTVPRGPGAGAGGQPDGLAAPGGNIPSCSSRAEFDRMHVWHPYSPAVPSLPAYEADRTGGCRIVLRGGESLVDGMSSWWCAVHGYNHPRLISALAGQAARMPHVMFGGLTHEPAAELARKLLEMAPGRMEHCFFADSGSVSVEVALKMAVQYQRAVGRPGKEKILAVRGGYHGDTFGAMSVCDPENGMHSLFTGVLARQIFAPRPECRFDSPYDPAPAMALEEIFEQNASSIAAMIIEPVVQGAGGMWMYHPEYLKRAASLCREHGCLLILDEVATGFGRTGRLFAAEWAGVSPDIACVGKALTGGVMTLAAAMCTAEVALGISAEGGALMHGPTFMANPLACAVANASLDIIREGGWRGQVTAIEEKLKADLLPCRDLPGVADVRALGAIGVVEMRSPVNVRRLQEYLIKRHSVWLRPFGRLIYIMPPYVISGGELGSLTAAIRGALEEEQWA